MSGLKALLLKSSEQRRDAMADIASMTDDEAREMLATGYAQETLVRDETVLLEKHLKAANEKVAPLEASHVRRLLMLCVDTGMPVTICFEEYEKFVKSRQTVCEDEYRIRDEQ